MIYFCSNYCTFIHDILLQCVILLSSAQVCFDFKVRVMGLLLNINFSGVIVILAYKPTITFRVTLWLLSVMNTSIKD